MIIPYVNCSNSDGIITHITASLSLNNSGSEYPSFQVWRPMSGDPSVYERIGDEIVLEDSEVRAMDGYWLAEIVVSDNERIEFKSGDVIGCYHPSNVRYQVNTISSNGSSVHDCDGGNIETVNTSNTDCEINPRQPLIQTLFSKSHCTMVYNVWNITFLKTSNLISFQLLTLKMIALHIRVH